jgi:2,3-dihydroxyphenylpropionate 1,2-dioxygenase
MDIVGAFACSHSGLMISRAAQAAPSVRDLVYSTFRAMGETIEALAPDAIVLVGTDHGRIYGFEGVPQFTIGVSEIATGIGDAGLPAGDYALHQELARGVLTGLLDRDVDIAFSEAMSIDHSFVAPMMLALPGTQLPIVPIVQNCNVPPLPSLGRSHRVGTALGDAIGDAGPGRVVVLGTGGLSHWVGSDDFRSFMNRPAGSRLAERDQHPLSLEDTGPVNEPFDETCLAQICAGRAADFIAAWSTSTLGEAAGNGAQEIRNWLVVAGAVSDATAKILTYAPVEEWLTGTGIVQFDI